FEVDLIVKDEGVVVAVECKSRLTREAVEEHGKRLGKIRRIASGYEGKVLYGAVAGMVVEEEAQRVAEEEGLYVLRQSGESVEIANRPGFEPKKF
ncbi:MAG: hypothetical protein NZL93_03750, partial [Chthoniobacterales bacterium]|nr:hypothetical protein [Chthoniobacterales bacterium]